MMRDADIAVRVKEAKENMQAADDLIHDYLPFIKSEAAKVAGRIPMDAYDDFVSIAMMAFHEAIERYDEKKGAFLSYASVIIKNRIIDFQRKEMRHQNVLSIHQPIGEEEDGQTLEDTLTESYDVYEERHMRNATREEIMELVQDLATYGLALTDVADNCPKQKRTLDSCRKVVQYAKEHPFLIDELVRTRRLPVTALCSGTGVEKKTLERHRKYIMALLVIYSNGYELIRGHLKQIFEVGKVGAAV